MAIQILTAFTSNKQAPISQSKRAYIRLSEGESLATGPSGRIFIRA